MMVLRRFRDTGRSVTTVKQITGLDDDTLSYLVRNHFVGRHGVLQVWDDLAIAQCLVYHELYGDHEYDIILGACRALATMPRRTWAGQSLLVGKRGTAHCVVAHRGWWAATGWSVIALDDVIEKLEGVE